MKKIFISICFLISLSILGQTKGRLPNKTLKDSVFNKGDIIKIPKLIFELSNPLGKQTLDSLQPVAVFLKQHLNLNVEISCHTGSSGKNTGNFILSENRAKKVWDYLTKVKGIDSLRISYKGYGETQLILSPKEIRNERGRKKKEKLEQTNQRTEIRVLEVK